MHPFLVAAAIVERSAAGALIPTPAHGAGMQQTRPPQEDALAIPIGVLDTRGWEARGLYYDVFALASNLLAGVALALDLYAAGYLRATTGAGPAASFQALARLGLEAAIFVASFAWLAARVVRAAVRDLPRA